MLNVEILFVSARGSQGYKNEGEAPRKPMKDILEMGIPALVPSLWVIRECGGEPRPLGFTLMTLMDRSVWGQCLWDSGTPINFREKSGICARATNRGMEKE